jgi:hypothetical protein
MEECRMKRRHDHRAIGALVLAAALSVAGCGDTTPRASGASGQPAATDGPAASPAASGTGATNAPASGSPTGTADIERSISEAVANASPLGLSMADRDLQDAIDKQSGLTAAIDPDLYDWLQEQRSAAGVAALEAAGIDPASVGPTGISTQPVASIDLGLTAATGIGWIGTGIVATGLIQAGAGSMGTGSGPSSTAPSQVSAETTIGDQHMAVTITVTTQTQVTGSMVIVDADAVESMTVTGASTGAAIGTSTSHNRIHVEANLCPDANGRVPVVVIGDWTEDAGGMPGGGGFTMHSTITVEATVDDNAYLVSATNAVDATFQGTSAGTTQSGSATTSWTQTMGSGGSITGGSTSGATGSITGSYPAQQAAALQGMSSLMPLMIASQVLGTAQDGWRGGKCVEIKLSERTSGLRPRQVLQFTAQPRHKLEGTDLDKPVIATFSGDVSLSPVDTPINAPAAFTYTAPPVDDKYGYGTFTSTSNRGIGKLDATFSVEYDGWVLDQQFPNAAGGTGSLLGYKCGGDPGGRWKAAGKYEALGFNGRQLWTVDLDASPTAVGNQWVWEGTYSYKDDSSGPYGVKQHTRVSGTVLGRIDEADGSMHMTLTETKRRQWTTVPGGSGSGPSRPQPTGRDLVWTSPAGC